MIVWFKIAYKAQCVREKLFLSILFDVSESRHFAEVRGFILHTPFSKSSCELFLKVYPWQITPLPAIPA
jgi:hypothetical protein